MCIRLLVRRHLRVPLVDLLHVLLATRKWCIQRKNDTEIGFASRQQDSQEFLRYLLQGLHEDVNRVQRKPSPIKIDEKAEARMKYLPFLPLHSSLSSSLSVKKIWLKSVGNVVYAMMIVLLLVSIILHSFPISSFRYLRRSIEKYTRMYTLWISIDNIRYVLGFIHSLTTK